MDLAVGRFLIRNAHSGNFAVLSDANHSTDLRGAIPGLRDDLTGETHLWQWIFVVLGSNGANKYKIQNQTFANFASCSDRPDEGEFVQGKTAPRQWVIKETNRPGQYTISAGSDPELYWGLGDDADGTPVELFPRSTDPHNQWKFQRISGLEDCIRDIQGDSRAARLKALDDFSSLAALQLHLVIQSGGLSIVSQLLDDSDTIIQSLACTSLTRLAQTVFPQLTVELNSWQPVETQKRALRTIVEFCIADEIKEVAVQRFMIPILVNMLDPGQADVASEVVEALMVLLRYPPARAVAHQVHLESALQSLIASDPPYTESALIMLTLMESTDFPSSPSRTERSASLSQPSMTSAESTETDEPLTPSSSPQGPWISDTPLANILHDSPPPSPPSRSEHCASVDPSPELQTPSIIQSNSVGCTPNQPFPVVPAPPDASVHALVVILQANDPTVWDSATLALRDATRSDTNAKSQALASGALPPLATILLSTSVVPLTMSHASEAIANIVSLSKEAKVAAVEYGIIPPLVKLLDDPFVWANAARALRYLCEHPLAREVCQPLNAIPNLVRLLDDWESSARINAAGALANLAADSRMSVVMFDAGIVGGLLRMITDSDASLHDTATAALWAMCSYTEIVYVIAQYIPRFIELLDSGAPQTCANICRILSNLCNDDKYLDTCFKAGIVPPLTQLLAYSNDSDALFRASRILSSIIVLEDGPSILASTGRLPALAKLLEPNGDHVGSSPDMAGIDLEIKVRVAHIVWGAISITEMRKELISLGVIPSLVKLVDSGHPLGRLYAAAALWGIFGDEGGQAIGVTVDAVPALLNLLMDTDADLIGRTKAAGALATLCTSEDGRSAFAEVDGMACLIICLDYEWEDEDAAGKNEFQTLICEAIKYFTATSNTMQVMAIDAIPKLIQLFRHPSLEVSDSAMLALSNIAQTTKTTKATRNAIPTILDILEQGDEQLTRKTNAATCLEAIAKNSLLSSDEFGRGIPGLIALLVTNNEPAQYAAARAMRQIVDVNWSAKSLARSNGAKEILKGLADNGKSERLRKHAGYTAKALSDYRIW